MLIFFYLCAGVEVTDNDFCDMHKNGIGQEVLIDDRFESRFDLIQCNYASNNVQRLLKSLESIHSHIEIN